LADRTHGPRLTLLFAAVLIVGAVVWWRSGERDTPAPHAAVPAAPATAPAATPAPPAKPPAPPAAPTAKDSSPEDVSTMNEQLLMARLREVAKTDSAKAIALAEEGNRRFADSADAPERESILIHALANAERRNEARGRAEYMVNHYPDSAWVREIEAFTGAHRHRNLTVNDAGQLIYTN
jgi:hypothetical protein